MKKSLIAIALTAFAATAVHAKDIVDTAVGAGNFKTLATALQAAGLHDPALEWLDPRPSSMALGGELLEQLLRERLVASAPARVVTVASRAHQWAPGLDWDDLRRPTRSLTGVREYMVSKLANVLFSAELGRQLAGSGVSSYAVHPGVVDTEIWRQVPRLLRPLLKLRGLRDPEQGAQTTLYCALQAPQHETGRYYADSALKTPSGLAQDQRLAVELWRFSEQILS